MHRTIYARYTLAAILAAASALPVVARTPYDGTWDVTIVTEAGSCDGAFRYPVRITDGTVVYNAEQGSGVVSISGKVDPSGQVRVSVRRGEQQAQGTGRLTQDAGAGAWTGKSATADCSGRWEARRK